MKISVAMATYNGANYIKEQLDSIVKQTMAVDEVIICDDCSKDNTVAIVNSFIIEHQLTDKWSIEINDYNLGYASNFIKAVKKTTGDIIFFCDQDDIWIENRVEKMALIMELNQDILMLGSEFEAFVSGDNAPSLPSWEKASFKRNNTLEHLKFQAKNIFIGCQGCSMCIRRKFFELIESYWYEGWAHDEYVWKLALCLDGAYVYHGSTLKRRLHDTNVTMHKMRDLTERVKFLEDLLRSHETMLRFARDRSIEEEAIRLIEKNIQAVGLRIGLLKHKKYFNILKLCSGYVNCYHSQKSIPVELYMAIRG